MPISFSPAAKGVLISVGIVGSVIVLPIGLALLFLSCCFCHKERDEQLYKQFHDCKF